ncbi:MAG: hypothetical protein JXK08_09955 [Flavobacteriaceae bacterium]|nr:hypothetical protein [Flavobacteriaceae bacterium]
MLLIHGFSEGWNNISIRSTLAFIWEYLVIAALWFWGILVWVWNGIVWIFNWVVNWVKSIW